MLCTQIPQGPGVVTNKYPNPEHLQYFSALHPDAPFKGRQDHKDRGPAWEGLGLGVTHVLEGFGIFPDQLRGAWAKKEKFVLVLIIDRPEDPGLGFGQIHEPHASKTCYLPCGGSISPSLPSSITRYFDLSTDDETEVIRFVLPLLSSPSCAL